MNAKEFRAFYLKFNNDPSFISKLAMIDPTHGYDEHYGEWRKLMDSRTNFHMEGSFPYKRTAVKRKVMKIKPEKIPLAGPMIVNAWEEGGYIPSRESVDEAEMDNSLSACACADEKTVAEAVREIELSPRHRRMMELEI